MVCRKLLAIEMKKIKIKMSKLLYLGLKMLQMNKTLMYEFWHDYIKPKYQNNVKNMLIKTLQIMLKKDLIHQIINSIDNSLQEKTKRWLN